VMRVFPGISFVALLSSAAFGQANTAKTAEAPHAFDVADVHVSPRSDWVKNLAHPMQGGFLSADRYELRRATMLDLIRAAYNVDADKIYGGPSWLDYDRFELVAKTKPGTRPEILRLMLQTLLADRFHLVVKMETRPVPGYVLSKGKGDLKLKAAVDGSSSNGCQTLRPTLDAEVMYTDIQCRNITMEAFAPALRRLVSGPLANLPIVDSTGLEGAWDIDVHYALRNASSGGPADASVVEAVDKLGLKLELGKVPQPVLVVENANEQPSANPPGLAASLPPLPSPEFEVASIRLPCNDNITMSPRFEPGGRLTATCMPLLGLITQVFNLAPFEQPAGVPKWLGSNSTASNISIVAKAPAGISPDPQNNAQARDTLNAMLRALLVDRYKLATHYEDRPMDADTLVAAKPKLTTADPANRTGCTRQNQQQQRGMALQVRLVCQNMTMAQFAEQIQAYDTDIHYPVLDGTGIDGAWDFTLNYDALANLAARRPLGGGAAAGPNGEASDPSGSISFVDAIEKQLGLKLEVHKRPEPVLVIDDIEEKPTAN
jgi:uncharacterized protein (TIGR03435 family)